MDLIITVLALTLPCPPRTPAPTTIVLHSDLAHIGSMPSLAIRVTSLSGCASAMTPVL